MSQFGRPTLDRFWMGDYSVGRQADSHQNAEPLVECTPWYVVVGHLSMGFTPQAAAAQYWAIIYVTTPWVSSTSYT